MLAGTISPPHKLLKDGCLIRPPTSHLRSSAKWVPKVVGRCPTRSPLRCQPASLCHRATPKTTASAGSTPLVRPKLPAPISPQRNHYFSGPSTEYITERCKISLKTICLIISVDALIAMQKLLWSFTTLILQLGTRLKTEQVVQTRVNDRSQLADLNQHVSSLCFQ